MLICFLLAAALAYSLLPVHPCPESVPADTCVVLDDHDHQESARVGAEPPRALDDGSADWVLRLVSRTARQHANRLRTSPAALFAHYE